MQLLLLFAQAISFAPVEGALDFVLQHNPTPEKHMLETMAGGLAVFDYNADGRPDIFFTNGSALPSLKKTDPKYHHRLFRNDGGWKFTDVTGEAGLAGEGYSIGAAAGDFDNDGHPDLFVTGVYRNTLYRNLGNGRFADVTAKSTIHSREWGIAAAWFDYDGDGLLDLFIGNYGAIDLNQPRFCGDRARSLRVYCHPKYYEPRPNLLYRNRGDGVFEDVSGASGIAGHPGRAMSVALADYDNDGRMDIFVTNDAMPNFLFRNLGKGKFEETALLAGTALLDHGKPIASMGADFRDYNNDGFPDIVVTALSGETFPLFRNQGDGSFQDFTYGSQLARYSNLYAGWGVGLIDFDNDGLKDLFTANSHVNDLVEKFEGAKYQQVNTVFRNAGGSRFELVPESGLQVAAKPHRGAVFADFDTDGRMDAVVSALSAPAELWRNTTAPAGNWLALRLRGVKSNRDAIGARIAVGKQRNHMTASVSYASSYLGPVHFGLGAESGPVRIEILWPSGLKQVIESVEPNRLVQIVEPSAGQ